MKKILFIPSTTSGGVYFYRTYMPMKQLTLQYPEDFDITINSSLSFTESDCEYAAGFDIVIVHNGLFSAEAQERFWKMLIYLKKKKVTLILDLDDYWDYGTQHPYYEVCRFNAFPEKMMINFKLFDYVTTTTGWFKTVISRYFDSKNVIVFPNALPVSGSQFTTVKNESDKIRLGIAGGSSHTEDIKQILGFGRMLTEKQLDSIELVFCGYDKDNAEKVTLDENGKVLSKERMDEKENWWWKTEQSFKSCFRNYRRVCTKSIMDGEYGKIYRDIDVLLVPLTDTYFNACKSELKFIEAGFTNTAVIASAVKPYSLWGIDGTDCIMVRKPSPEYWAQAVKKILNKKGLLEYIRDNNHKRITKERSLERITGDRAQFLLSI